MRRLKKGQVFILVLAFLLLLPVSVEAESKVKLNKTKTTVYIGSTTDLKLTGTKKKATWSSSNKKIAAVNSRGRVTAKKTGTVTITAKVSGKKYTCRVTVKKPYVNATKKTLYIGNTYTLKLIGTSIKSVKTSSSKVASISKKGKITAKATGKAVITLKGKDNKNYKCTVTVKKPFINTSKKSLEIGETYTLKLTGTSIVSASSSNTKVASISSKGKITAKKDGEATVTLTGKNGKKYKCAVTVIHKHSYSSEVVKTATCSQTGISFYSCVCGAGYEKTIEKLSHNWKYSHIFYDQKADKYISYYSCSMCSEKKEQYDKVCKHTDHVERGMEVPATCVNEGIINCQCLTCTRKWTEIIPKKEHSFQQELDEDNGQMFTCNVCATVNFQCFQPDKNANTAVIKLTEDRIALLPEGVVIVLVQREILSGDKWDKLSMQYSNPDIMYPLEEQEAEGTFEIRGKKAGTTDFIVSYDGVELMRVKITVGLPYEEAVRQYYNGNINVFDEYTDEARAVVTGTVDILSEIVTEDMTDYEKVSVVTDWFARNTNGGSGFGYEDQNLELYGILGNEAHVGNAKARVKAFSLLMNTLDIPCYAISGTSGVTSYMQEDMWAAVCIDIGNGKAEQWYYVVLADTGRLITDKTVEEFNEIYGKGIYEITIDNPIVTPEDVIYKQQYRVESSKKTGQLEYSTLDGITGQEFLLVH